MRTSNLSQSVSIVCNHTHSIQFTNFQTKTTDKLLLA
jgi:hypothetical protein